MRNAAFQPKNINAQVVEELGRRIIRGDYSEGEKLPIEAELCEEFGVSRPILREATKILMAKGLVTSRPRVGTLVTTRKRWNLLDPDVLNWLVQSMPEEEFLDKLFEVRMAIEPAAARLAAQNASEDDLSEIGRAFADMASAQRPADLAEPDLRFHQAIMDATHNSMMSYIGYTLHYALSISIQLTSLHPDTYELSVPRHEAVFIAIRDKDGDAAYKATVSLLQDSRADFDRVARNTQKA